MSMHSCCYWGTGPTGERLQADIEDAPVLDRPAPLRRFYDSGIGYKYLDLLTYMFCCATPEISVFIKPLWKEDLCNSDYHLFVCLFASSSVTTAMLR